MRVLGWTIRRAGGGRSNWASLKRSTPPCTSRWTQRDARGCRAEAKFAKFRRTLAGALVTLAGDRITVERAPPRRAGRKRQNRLTTRRYGRRKRLNIGRMGQNGPVPLADACARPKLGAGMDVNRPRPAVIVDFSALRGAGTAGRTQGTR